MTEPLRGRAVVLGVTGSIAAYKSLTVASRLASAEAQVDVILTEAASHLVQPLAFQALTHRPVISSLWQPVGPMALDHVAVGRQADIFLVAPATAHAIARLALGLADDALTTSALVTTAPLVLAPAMEPHMWAHQATQEHVATLVKRGATILGPVTGRTATGETGLGRMVEPEAIVEHLRWVFGRSGDLAGRRILITAGLTHEPIDPVRFLGNHSSGRMGYALAREARDRGAEVILVSGPVALNPPTGVRLVAVQTALQMRAAVLDEAPGVDAVIMTAAVADYRPRSVAPSKIERRERKVEALQLEPNPDILMDLAKALGERPAEQRPIRIGFAAETDDLVANASAKRIEKDLDLIVANPVPQAFGALGAEATLIGAGGVQSLGWRPKEELAATLLDWLRDALTARPHGQQTRAVD